jgi:hypothetical protein
MALLAAEQVRLPEQHNLTQFTSPDSSAAVDGPS